MGSRRRELLVITGIGTLLSAFGAWHQYFLPAVAIFVGGVVLPFYLFKPELTARSENRLAVPPVGSETPPVLHATALDDLEAAGYGDEFLGEIAEGFARDGLQLLADMDAALEAKDLSGFRDLAHTLKGNAVSVGAHRLAQTCQRAEAVEQPSESPGPLMASLRGEFNQALTALEGYLTRNRAVG